MCKWDTSKRINNSGKRSDTSKYDPIDSSSPPFSSSYSIPTFRSLAIFVPCFTTCLINYSPISSSSLSCFPHQTLFTMTELQKVSLSLPRNLFLGGREIASNISISHGGIYGGGDRWGATGATKKRTKEKDNETDDDFDDEASRRNAEGKNSKVDIGTASLRYEFLQSLEWFILCIFFLSSDAVV